MTKTKELFNLIGLNKKTEGIYATIEVGNEDWFHCPFDTKFISIERQDSLFNMFKLSEENLWKAGRHQVTIEFEGKYPSGIPIKPVIVDLHLIL
jgi:hypothetical protein